MIEGKSITAVLFVYNQEKYLKTMLDSVLNQTVEVDSIVVVDDFSTDSTKKIILQYCDEHPHIHYHLSRKKGKVHAYVTGLMNVTTDLFFIGAGDDFLLPNYVESLFFEGLIRNGVRYCYARYFVTDSELNNRVPVSSKSFYTKKELLRVNYTSGYLFGESSIIRAILPLPEGLLFEDWFTSIKLAHTFGKNHVSEQPLFLYRKHDQGATSVSGLREKYLYSFTRDLVLYESLLKADLITGLDELNFVKAKIDSLKVKLNYNLGHALLLLLKTQIPLKERVKILFFPLFLTLKYRN
jgi:glycosyltransferase involved in cell wall biosynthesis